MTRCWVFVFSHVCSNDGLVTNTKQCRPTVRPHKDKKPSFAEMAAAPHAK